MWAVSRFLVCVVRENNGFRNKELSRHRVNRSITASAFSANRSEKAPSLDGASPKAAMQKNSSKPNSSENERTPVIMNSKSGYGRGQGHSGTTPAHHFEIGQAVYLRDGFGRNNLSSDTFHITGRLPSKDGLPQYRIRGDKEAHERMVTQDRLEAVGGPSTDANKSLIEKTFGLNG